MSSRCLSWTWLLLCLPAVLAVDDACAADVPAEPRLVFDDPSTVKDPDFAIQGEYSGDVKTDDGIKKLGVQVIALGSGKFRAVAYIGGLPGEGWDGSERLSSEAATKDGSTSFTGDKADARLKDGSLTITDKNGTSIGVLKRLERKSPTLGAKPPEGAVVLFDGNAADKFENGHTTADHLLLPGVTSRQKFGSCSLHLEFRTPYQPNDRGQKRGNSGCYLQGRYEAQILDSFGLEGKNNECGGLYQVKDPDLNMCFPPLTWQTYDIDFTAATYEAGKKTKNARMTVRLNGVVVQKDVELPGSTTAAPVAESAEPGPLYLQDHGNPVRFRNIWIVEKK